MPEQLKHSMYEFEVTPPPAAWANIASRLYDDEKYSLLSSKVKDFEISPPSDAWNNILASLDETKINKTETPVINIRRKLYRFAAASIILAVLIGAWIFMNKTNTKIDVTANASKPFQLNAEKPIKKNNQNYKPQQNGTKKEKDQPGYSASKTDLNTIPPTYNNDRRILKYTIVNVQPSYTEHPITINFSHILNEKGAVVRNMDMLTSNSSYLIIAGPDGQPTKISSKFANIIRYINSEDDMDEYPDNVNKESSIWKKRFQEWRSKISHSAFIPSSTNFLDLIELKELIEEKQ